MKLPVCLAFLLMSGPAAAAPSGALPFALTSHGAIIVPVIVNGSESASFLVDTGSNGSVISKALATALGADVVARTTMTSASGQKDALVARIEHLTLGSVGLSGVLATIVPAADLNPPDVAAAGLEVQGLLGQDVLGQLRYTIDYKRRQILWREAAVEAPPKASRFELERADDRFLIRLPQADRELRVVPDSGADALVLFEGAERVAEAAPPGTPVGLTGLAGTRRARATVVRRLHVGGATLTDVAAVILPHEAGSPSVDALLPLHLFARVSFDGPERQLFIEQR